MQEEKELGYLNNPSKAPEYGELIDQNLEALMGTSELHDQIEVGMTEKVEIEELEIMANDLTGELNSKAKEYALRGSSQLKKLQVLKNANLVVGNKRDYLVNKFCSKLKQKVMDKKDETL